MKIFVAVLTIIVAVATFEDKDWVAGIVAKLSPSADTIDTESFCSTAVNFATSCDSSGCDSTDPDPTVKFCYEGSAYDLKTCTGSTPYCSGGACVATAPKECYAKNFNCPGPGFFPQYDDCYTYYNCTYDGTTNKIIAKQVKCPTGYAFNPTGPVERLCLRGQPCMRVYCTPGKFAEWKPINYAGFTTNQIAIYCVNGAYSYIDSCNSGWSIDATNATTKNCSIRCSRDYLKAVAIDNNGGYNLCLGGKYYFRSCENGQIFDGVTLSCKTKVDTNDNSNVNPN
ncbi:hypothetical protein PVAND_017308 [Polypedilum vanderplanki]|uniref:Chitin-binding type-2 domain-containing protein n=1 Tax=Polypedilum vanderplanki TaxID=319348 RepID=A0A9J6BHX2_POLVA|nr:hypothetical protein PVAND_017308 [Polypedilum vanderplanki]